MVSERQKLSDKELRDKIKLARRALSHQAKDTAADLASMSVDIFRRSKEDQLRVGGKQNALTAMTEKLSEALAIIEFIDQLDFEGKNRSSDAREVLSRRHAGIVSGLQRSAGETSSRAVRILNTCMEARDKGKVVPMGEKVRSQTASEHARLMKDLAVLGFIQSFGVVTRSTRHNDL